MTLELIKELDKRVRTRLVSKVTNKDLAIYCYTQKCVYEKAWDKYTKMSRGLIINLKTGEIVARPFTKFFNLNETDETKLKNLPREEPEVTEKLDGSLGILYCDEGQYFITTKGTFYSEQGQWATEYFRKKFGKKAVLFFLCGTDAVQNFSRWRKPEELLKLARFVVMTRTGSSARRLPEGMLYLPMETVNVSSTEIRSRLKKNQTLSGLLPKGVERRLLSLTIKK